MAMPFRGPAHTGTFPSVVPTTLEERKEHEQVYKSIARHLALSISPGMVTEVPIPDTARAGRARGIQMHHGILLAVGMRSSGVE